MQPDDRSAPSAPVPSRRSFLQRSAGLGGGLLLAPGFAWATNDKADSVILDFRGAIPAGVSFRRASQASYIKPDGVFSTAAVNVPRFMGENGKPLGLLIEGTGRNLLVDATQPASKKWSVGGGTSATAESGEAAPDGSVGVFRVRRATPAPNSLFDTSADKPVWSEYGTASVWLRSTSGPGTWRLRLRDFSTYNGVSSVVEVDPQWRRYSLSFAWQLKDKGAKRFSVLDNEAPVLTSTPPVYQLNRVNPYKPVATPLSLDNVLMWGWQYETANHASSFIMDASTRAADEVHFPASLIDSETGSLTILLPQGGRRGGTILDAAGDQGGVSIAYSNSGWILARIGSLYLAGFSDVTADPIVRLEWGRDGAQLLTGDRPQSLIIRAVQRRSPHPVQPGESVRLGMKLNGEQPIDRPIASVSIEKSAPAALGPLVVPSIIPVSYLPSFSDDFDDKDVSRINENATSGHDGAPAWRSRFRQARKDVINKEKQIYMDPAFAGTGSQPLGVQPFSIQDGVLRIRADRADPNVSSQIWNYRYTSGCISSELTHAQTYGYFEMRAKLPRGKGFWPAFWLLPVRNAWPPEIDVLEASGARPYGVHCGVLEKPRTAKTPPGAWIDQLIDTSDGFHTYAVDWTPSNIIFFVDGTKTFEYGPHNIHEDMYMLVNLALGSHDPNWIPDPDDSTPFPGVLEIDYIHAFKRAA